MTGEIPRLRMFAGPNGSGKTTVKNGLQRSPSWFGIYINPDDLEKSIQELGKISLESFEVVTTTRDLRDFFAESTLLRQHQLNRAAQVLEYQNGIIDFCGLEMNSYYASVLADFLRRQCLSNKRSFSFETVMSSSDKVELLQSAQNLGFRTYLYFVATEDPAINLARVQYRVKLGGHDVPKQKIVSRYHRSLGLLRPAIQFSNRAFFFDTSGQTPWYFAEAIDGARIELKSNELPNWFQPVWDQF